MVAAPGEVPEMAAGQAFLIFERQAKLHKMPEFLHAQRTSHASRFIKRFWPRPSASLEKCLIGVWGTWYIWFLPRGFTESPNTDDARKKEYQASNRNIPFMFFEKCGV
jgi:hypothetical protein